VKTWIVQYATDRSLNRCQFVKLGGQSAERASAYEP
jgi:hypothetical protein